MITEHDLQEAIEETQGKRDPNANDCIKLAAFYTIKNELFPKRKELPELPTYSLDPAPISDSIVNYDSGSEFAQMIRGKRSDDVFKRLDRAFEELRYLNPKLYNAMLDELV